MIGNQYPKPEKPRPAYARHRIIVDDCGKPNDYVLLEANAGYEKATGITKEKLINRRASSITPDITKGLFNPISYFNKILINGSNNEFEEYDEATGKRYSVHVYSGENTCITTILCEITATAEVENAENNTKNKRVESELPNSKELLLATLHYISDGVIWCDGEGRIMSLNRAAEELTGYLNNEAAGQAVESVFDIKNSQSGQPAENPIKKTLISGICADEAVQATLVSRTGTAYQISISCAPLSDAGGRVIGALLVFRNTTSEYRQSQELRTERERLEYILNITRTGIDIVDANRNLHYVDKGWAQIYGDPAGRKCYEYFRNKDKPCCDCSIPKALLTKQVVVSEKQLPKENNRIVEAHTIPFVDADGQWLLAELKVDITERKTREIAIKHSEMRARLQRNAITEIVLDQIFAESETEPAVKRLVEVLSVALDVSRTSVWMFAKDREELHCISLYDSDSKAFQSGAVLKHNDYPNYFSAIMSENRIAAENAHLDTRTADFSPDYLNKHGIVSMLDAGIFNEGKLLGVICTEHRGDLRKWHPDEELFVSTIAAIVAQLFANAKRKQTEKSLIASKSRIHALLKAIPDIMFVISNEGFFIDYYASNVSNLLQPPSHFIGKHVSEVLPPQLTDITLEKTQKAILTKEIQVYEYQLVIDNRNNYFEARVVSLDNDNSLSIIRDITERKQAEEALEAERNQLFSLFNSIEEAVYIADPGTYELLYVNRHLASMLDDDYTGKKCYRVLQGLDSPCPFCTNQIIIAQKPEPHTWQHYNPNLDKYYAVINRIIRWSDGRDVRFEMAVDITRIKKAEKKLAEKNKELEQIIYVASHDLRSPLVNVDGFSRELEYSIKDLESRFDVPETDYTKLYKILRTEFAEMKSSIDLVRSSTRQMDNLLKGLLKLSRAGRAALTITHIDMNKLVKQLMISFAFRIKENDIDLIIDDLPPCIGDESQLIQVFSNIIDNAVKYLDKNRKGVIRIAGREKGNKSVYFIIDNGIGITEKHKEHVFELFYRINQDNKRGEGLGLTITRQVLARFDGEITVKSRPGKGCMFIVGLPASK